MLCDWVRLFAETDNGNADLCSVDGPLLVIPRIEDCVMLRNGIQNGSICTTSDRVSCHEANSLRLSVPNRLVAFLETCEEVRECHHVTGSDALMIKVLVGSIEELEQLVMKFLRYGVPTTSVVLSTPLVRNQYRLDGLYSSIEKT